MNLNELLDKSRDLNGQRFILGVDGLSRSGKTTFVKEIGHYLKENDRPFHIFHIDDYIVKRSNRYNTGHEEWFEYYQLQWDTQWLVDNFFRSLKASNTVVLPYYCGETDTHTHKRVMLPNNGVIIVEGVFLQRDEWREYFDFVLYLDCAREVRFKRESLKTQENVKKFEERYWKAEDYYLQNIQPLKSADLVVRSK
ncbi:kinase [Bacillus suaedaesalsae]|uniref:Phosphoribulokinase/uridine kinase domain-containing protein n=1 Tax=Bacillus suaedaesalsae TaxID=2810349 RepID=A0ABS2DLA2_9BACI|nr:kinase [Bacillus suaedaesalsae]MBM6618810.1 hypothetical protein [Bacillus suaedaesalsae]